MNNPKNPKSEMPFYDKTDWPEIRDQIVQGALMQAIHHPQTPPELSEWLKLQLFLLALLEPK